MHDEEDKIGSDYITQSKDYDREGVKIEIGTEELKPSPVDTRAKFGTKSLQIHWFSVVCFLTVFSCSDHCDREFRIRVQATVTSSPFCTICPPQKLDGFFLGS